jgi:alpha-beta hydrolase superfamily lysophospholipase
VPEIKTFTTTDGYVCHYRHYPASGEVRGRIVCIHGIQSHGGWYTRSCERLACEGFDVFFLDRRGSGLNEQSRGDCPSFRRLLDDIVEFVTFTKTTCETPLKTHLLCISWGGKLGVGVQYRSPELVDRLILICPGIVARVSTPLGTRLRITLCKYPRPRKLFPIPLNDPKLFTASPEWQQFLANDPLALREGTARLLSESVLLGIYLKRAKNYVTIPTLLMLAEKDQIVNNDAVRKFFDKFPTPEKTIIEYPGAEHTLEFEPEGHPFLDDLVKWLR